MPLYPFSVGGEYTKKDIYRICAIPTDKQRGNWDTGYASYQGDWFIFCNVGVPGRTGHDYQNRFVGDDLIWFGKTASSQTHPSIKALISSNTNIYVFWREINQSPFTFAGLAKAIDWSGDKPVKIIWSFEQTPKPRIECLAEEVAGVYKYTEGATKSILVNSYERNPQARKTCINAHGCSCVICNFNFSHFYGEVGHNFIHVHHLKPLADIGTEYELDAVTDLRPVCPNCHAMLHRRRPAYSIDELKAMLKRIE